MKHHKRYLIGLVFAALSVANGESALALKQNDILGKWCGVKTNPNWADIEFTHDELAVTYLPSNKRNILKIDQFEFTETTVKVHYFVGKDLFDVTYGNLGADGKTMVQLHDSKRPRDAYYTRC